MTAATIPAPVPDPVTLALLARSPRIEDQALARAASPDFPAWLGHVHSASRCSRPIRLAGHMSTVDAATNRVITSTATADLPDGVIYKACGNRRESVCPACAKVYKRDAQEIVRSLLVGGHGVPDTVARHPGVFATLTAPGFGEVHTRITARHTCHGRERCDCRPEPCHARRNAPRCPHRRLTACFARHAETDRILGTPLCRDCYDYDAQAVWNLEVPELWRRSIIAVERYLARLCRERGIPFWEIKGPDGKIRRKSPVKLAFAKVGEWQRRAVIHLHAVIRLDGWHPADPDAILPPPAGIGAEDLAAAIKHAARVTAYQTGPHPVMPAGWPIRWGDKGIDARPISVDATGPVTVDTVSYYLAKYATKSTEVTGHVSGRLTTDTINLYADPEGSHAERLIDACWRLGGPDPTAPRPARPRRAARATVLGPRWTCPDCATPTRLRVCPTCQPTTPDTDAADQRREPVRGWRRLRFAAHEFGFAGHFITKSRRHKVTFGQRRQARATFTRRAVTSPAPPPGTDQPPQEPTTLQVNFLAFVGAGWRNPADAMLATLPQALAREHQRAAQTELATHT